MKRIHRTDKILSTRHYSKNQEEQIVDKLGGQRQLNSGATPFQKGDVSLDKWLIEAKTKVKDSKSFTIQKDWLDKNLSESLFMGKDYNALAFNFGPDQKNYYIIDEQTFKQLINLI